MNKLIFLALLFSSSVFADGFVCETYDGNLRVKVFNKVDPQEGTRNANVMVLSNPRLQSGNKSIAVFKAGDALLDNHGASYTANVDLRFSESNRAGKYIGGTRLGELDQITLDVEFKYNNPVAKNTVLDGVLTLEKRDPRAKLILLDVFCVRYLKRYNGM